MGNHAVVATGTVGVEMAVACCASPWLVTALAAFGLAGAAAWSDRVLVAVTGVLTVLSGYWSYHRHRMAGGTKANEGIEPDDR